MKTNPRILYVSVTKEWFDMELSGDKKEEYRVISPFWINRLFVCNHPKEHRSDNKTFAEDFIHDLKMFRPLDFVMKSYSYEFRQYDVVRIVNGYGDHRPTIDVEFKGVRIGKPISGLCDEGWLDTNLFVIELGDIIDKRNIV